jgi:hypothetical protein
MKSHITSHQDGKGRKSSQKARRLIEAVVKQCGGNEREAARRLQLPNHAQLRKMRRGQIGDTPAMRAALLRAEERARRADGERGASTRRTARDSVPARNPRPFAERA